jgi:hypothetical protein
MKFRRFLLVALIVLAIVVASGFFAARYYLHSPAVAHQVSERLQAMYGAPVRVGKVDVGIGGSSLEGFELFEKENDADKNTPWLTVGSINTDISLWDVIRGAAMPKHVTLKQVKVVLRFDAAGRLITRFPALGGTSDLSKLNEAPEVVLEQGEVALHKQGEPALTARDVNAKLTRDETGNIVLSGNGLSEALGKLLIDGSVTAKTGNAVVTLKTTGAVHFTQSVLNRVPFVPPVTWQELQVVEGESTAALTVHYDLHGADLHWKLALAPTRTTVRIPVLDLTAHDATAGLVVNDYRINLRNANGKAYGGDVQLDADLDFSGPESKLSFSKIVLKDLDVAKVPESWNPAELGAFRRLAPNGKLSGTASVTITLTPGKVAPALVDALVGLSATSSGSDWLPAVTALAAFPRHEMHSESAGKATITGFAGGSAEIDLKLGPHPTQPVSGPPLPRSGGEGRKLVTARPTSFQAPGPDAYPALNTEVGREAGKLVRGIQALLQEIVSTGGEFVAGLPRTTGPAAPVTPETPTTYLDLNLKLEDVDIAQLVRGLKVKLNTPVAGKLSVQVKISIPTNRGSDLKAYKLKGSAQGRQVRFDGIEVPTLDADINYANGVLDLSSFKGRFAAPVKGQPPDAGTFTGRGNLQVVPLGAVAAELTLDRIPVSAVAELTGTERVGGVLSGQLSVRGPADKLKDIAALEGGGKLTVDKVSAYGLALQQVTTGVQLKGGVLRLVDLHSTFQGTPITASAELKLSGDYPFKANTDLKNWDLAALEKIAGKGQEPPVKIAGSFTTTADVRGTLKPFTLNASGDASAAKLIVDRVQLSSARFRWSSDGKTLSLSKLDVRLYGGATTGSAVLPLQSTASGSVDLKLKDLDARHLVKDLAVPVKIEGQVGGVVKGTLPPAQAGKMRVGTFDLDVTAPKLQVQNIPTQQLHGKLDYQNGVVDYKLEGKTLGGTFELDGQIPSGEPVKKESGKGKLRIDSISLARLSEALGLTTVPIHGQLSIRLDFTQDSLNHMPNGTGTLRLTDLRWHEAVLIPSLTGDLILRNGVLQLRELSGEVARGLARLGLTYDLRHPDRSRFFLILENVEAAQLLAPWTDDKIKGTMQASIRGSLGAHWYGKANLELTRGEVYGMEVTNWRLPADWQYFPASGRSEVEVYETTAQVARGRMQGKLTATYDYGLRLDGNARFFGVDLQTLIRPFAGTTSIAAGQVTGQFTFSGTEIHSVKDLTGNLFASFSQAQPLQVPGLNAITPYIGMGPTTTFERGELRARLDRGTLRVQRFAMEGGTLKLFADGTVALSGPLNLNVVAKTGDVGLPTLRLGAIGLRIPITGPLPITVLQEVSNLLANRVIYLEVTGTIHSPVVRLRALQMLTEEAVRFFIQQTPLPVPLAP